MLGAGVGVVVLAIGAFVASPDDSPDAVFLIASACGFVAVLASLWVIWRRSGSTTDASVA